ncbi:MAG: hypothetical protein ACRDGN_16885 [bacterium]
MFLVSVVLVVLFSGLAIAVSPFFFLALLLSLAVPAFLTVRTYKSPNER